MSRKLMPESGVLVPHVVMNRDAAVAGVFAVDGEKGSIDLTKKYVLITAFNQKIGEVEARIKTVEDTIVTINTSIENINTAIQGINTSIGTKASKGINSDITELRGLSTALSVAQGGTGAKNGKDAIKNLGGLAVGDYGIGGATPIAMDANKIDGGGLYGGGGVDGLNYYDQFTPILHTTRNQQRWQIQVSLGGRIAARASNSAGSNWTNWTPAVMQSDFGIGAVTEYKLSTLGLNSGFFGTSSIDAGTPYNGCGFQAVYDPYRRAQVFINGSGEIYSRFLSDNVINNDTPWKKSIYLGYTTPRFQWGMEVSNKADPTDNSGRVGYLGSSSAANGSGDVYLINRLGNKAVQLRDSGEFLYDNRAVMYDWGYVINNNGSGYGGLTKSDDLPANSTAFAYSDTGFGNFAGPVVTFGGGSANLAKYRLQIKGRYSGTNLLTFRLYDGDRNTWGAECNIWHSGNTTVDTNGFIKRASPVVKVFSDGTYEANEEAKGVHVERLDVGHYMITGALGFNSEQPWEITVPSDNNGQNLLWVDYEMLPTGDIEVFTYHRTHPTAPKFAQNIRKDKYGREIEDGEPIDIPQYRWIDLRLNM